MWFLVLGLAFASFLEGAEKRKKTPKLPDLEIVEASARRDGEQIALDGRVKNTGQKPIHGLVLVFDFLSDDGIPLTTQKATVEDEVVELGQEARFRMGLNAPPRAVAVRINAMDANSRELSIAKSAPFPID